MQSKVYSKDGKEVGNVELPEEIFGLPWNADLVHQVVVGIQANARISVAHTHDRGEQRGGGHKPWKQKGTGRARHGSRRSPIWRGGGVTHGPRNDKDYSKKINAKMRTKALYTVLSRKLKDNEVVFLDSMSFSEPKTKEAQAIVKALGGIKEFVALKTKVKNAAFLTVPNRDENTFKSFKNLTNVSLGEIRNLNPVDVLSYKYLIISNPKDSFITLSAKRGITQKVKQKKEKEETKMTKTATKVVKKAKTSKAGSPDQSKTDLGAKKEVVAKKESKPKVKK